MPAGSEPSGSGRARSARPPRGRRRHHRARARPCAGRGHRPARRCGRPRWRARNQSAVHSPRPRSAVSCAFTSSSGRAREALEVEIGAREPDHVLGLAPREAEREELLLRRRRDPLARRERPDAADRSPNRSTSRLRIARAAKSETCCAVIAPTSISNGSARERRTEAGEADDERSQLLVSRRPRGEGDEVEVEARAPCGRRLRSPRRAARRRRRPPPPRSAPPARRRRDRALRPPTASRGRARTRGSAPSRARSRTAPGSRRAPPRSGYVPLTPRRRAPAPGAGSRRAASGCAAAASA